MSCPEKKKKKRNFFFHQFTQKYACGISFGGGFFLPVRVKGKADPITSVVVSKHILVHEGHSGNNEPQQPDRGQDHLVAETTSYLEILCSVSKTGPAEIEIFGKDDTDTHVSF